MRTSSQIAAVALLALLLIASPTARAADQTAALSPVERAAGCAPVPSVARPAADVLRVAGAYDSLPRTTFGSGDYLIIDGGSQRGLRADQAFYVRRPMDFATGGGILRPGERPLHTAGWIRIVSVNDTKAIAQVEQACGVILQGDYLEPFTRPVLPPGYDRVDTTGTLDFLSLGRVLFGDMDRVTAAPGDYMIVDRGAGQGVATGARLAIYRDLESLAAGLRREEITRLPLVPIGEAIVVSTAPSLSLVRVVSARDAVRSGDFIVPRK